MDRVEGDHGQRNDKRIVGYLGVGRIHRVASVWHTSWAHLVTGDGKTTAIMANKQTDKQGWYSYSEICVSMKTRM